MRELIRNDKLTGRSRASSTVYAKEVTGEARSKNFVYLIRGLVCEADGENSRIVGFLAYLNEAGWIKHEDVSFPEINLRGMVGGDDSWYYIPLAVYAELLRGGFVEHFSLNEKEHSEFSPYLFPIFKRRNEGEFVVVEAGKAIRVYGSDKTGLFGAFDRLGNNISGSDVPFSWYTEHLGEFELSTSASMRLMDKYGMGWARFYWCLSRSIEKENLRRRNK